jgi:hypothetical protein
MSQVPIGLFPVLAIAIEGGLEEAKVLGALVDKIKNSAKKIASG